MKDNLEKLVAELADGGVFLVDAVSELEKKFIQRVLLTHRGNRSEAAKALGIHRNTLGRKMVEYHLVSKNGLRPSRSRRTKARRNRPRRGTGRQT